MADKSELDARCACGRVKDGSTFCENCGKWLENEMKTTLHHSLHPELDIKRLEAYASPFKTRVEELETAAHTLAKNCGEQYARAEAAESRLASLTSPDKAREIALEVLSSCALKYAKPEMWNELFVEQEVINHAVELAAAIIQQRLGDKL